MTIDEAKEVLNENRKPCPRSSRDRQLQIAYDVMIHTAEMYQGFLKMLIDETKDNNNKRYDIIIKERKNNK